MSNRILDNFIEILKNYTNSKGEDFAKHSIANIIRNETVLSLEQELSINKEKYKIKGSPGNGNWADVPWVAVFDKDITTSATKGYYIVYLFCADMSGVYVSLNQGWTYFREKYGTKVGRDKITTVAKAWKNTLHSSLNDFSYDRIDLKNDGNNSNLAEGYELGHICGKFYGTDNMPPNDEIVQDLRNLMGVYRELKGRMKELSVEKTNNNLLTNAAIGVFDRDVDDGEIESNIEKYEESILTESEVPEDFRPKGDRKYDFKAKKTDFFKKTKQQKKLGLAGELMVLKHEKEYLINNGKKDLAKKVEHTSEEKGDGTGYDILSYDLDGNEKFIEVKTTSQNGNSNFIISDNEVEFSKRNTDNYYLYRVYNYDKNVNTGDFFIIKGNLEEKMNLKPRDYTADGIKN